MTTATIVVLADTADADAKFASLAARGEATEDALAHSGSDASNALADAFNGGTTKAGNALDKLGKKMSDLGVPFGGSLSKMGQQFDQASTKGERLSSVVSDLGKVSLLAGAAGFAAFAAVGVKLAADMQESEARIAASAGISTKAAADIGNAFLDTAGKTEFSGAQMASAYEQVAGQLGATQGKALSTAQALHVMMSATQLAEATGESLGDATKSLATVMQVYGVQASGASQTADVLYSTSRKTGVGLGSLTTTIQRLHTQIGDLTPPLGQLGGLLVDMATHGMSGRSAISAVSTSLRTMMTSASGVQTEMQKADASFAEMPPHLKELAQAYLNGSISGQQLENVQYSLPAAQAAVLSSFTSQASAVVDAKEKYAAMGIQVLNSKGQFVGLASVIGQLHDKIEGETEAEKVATVSQVFGTSAAQKMLAVVEAGPAVYDRASQAVTKAGAAAKAAAEQEQTLHGQFEILKSDASDLATKFGALLLPILSSAAKWLAHNTDVVKALAVAIGAILGASIVAFVGGKLALLGQGLSAVISKFLTMIGVNQETADSTTQLSETMAQQDAQFRALQEAIGQSGISYADLVNTEKLAQAQTEALQQATDALASSYGLLGEEAPAAAAVVDASVTDMEVTTDAAASNIDAAIGSTGIGLIVVALGIAVMELYEHWRGAWTGIEEVAYTVANAVINVINAIISAINDLSLGLAGLSKVGHVTITHGSKSNKASGPGGISMPSAHVSDVPMAKIPNAAIPEASGPPGLGDLGAGGDTGGSTSTPSSSSSSSTTSKASSYQSAAQSLLQDLQQAIQSGTESSLRENTTGARHEQLDVLVRELNSTHKTALENLAQQLERTWTDAHKALNEAILTEVKTARADGIQIQAQALQARTQKTADASAAEVTLVQDMSQKVTDAFQAAANLIQANSTAQTDAINAAATQLTDASKLVQDAAAAQVQAISDQSQISTDAASAQATEIADQAQTQADTLGERGQFGLDLIAQQEKVAADQAQATNDAAIAAAQAHLDQVTAQQNQLIAIAQQKADQAQAQGDAKTAVAQAAADRQAIVSAQAEGTAQARADAIQITQEGKVAAAQAHADTVAIAEAIKEQAAQNAVTMAQFGSASAQAAAQAQEALVSAQSTLANEHASSALQQAQNAANQANANAQAQLNATNAAAQQAAASTAAASAQAQAQAAAQEATANATLAAQQSSSNVLVATAQAQLAAAQNQAAVQEAQLNALYTVTEAMAQTEFAGSGAQINIYGLAAGDAAAVGDAVSWVARTKLNLTAA